MKTVQTEWSQEEPRRKGWYWIENVALCKIMAGFGKRYFVAGAPECAWWDGWVFKCIDGQYTDTYLFEHGWRIYGPVRPPKVVGREAELTEGGTPTLVADEVRCDECNGTGEMGDMSGDDCRVCGGNGDLVGDD